jgi:hypothetical protein
MSLTLNIKIMIPTQKILKKYNPRTFLELKSLSACALSWLYHLCRPAAGLSELYLDL